MSDPTPLDREALEPLTEALRAYVRRRVRDADAADDLVQDVLTRLVQERASSGGPRRIAGWLFRAAHNAIVDRYRRHRPEVPAGDLVDSTPVEDPEPEDLERLRQSLRAFVHALPPDAREALLLADFEGVGQRELAARLGLPASTVKSRVQRARARLAADLHRCCTFELDRRGGVIDYRRRARRDDCCAGERREM